MRMERQVCLKKATHSRTQNKSFVKGVMKLGDEIFDLSGELTGSYARERILIEGYKNITRIGGLF